MKNATEFANKFKKFKKQLPEATVEKSEHGVIGEIIYAHLLWNAQSKQAAQAYKKLFNAAVDLNDIRVNHIYETVELIGEKYPQAYDRAKRLKSVLNAIYKREHGMHVNSLEGAGKREVREYFVTLDGMTPFVCNRVISLQYDVSAMPVDDRTLIAMATNDLVHEKADVNDAASWLSRLVKASEACDVHVRLQAWVELQPVPKPKKVAPRKLITKPLKAKKDATTSATKKTDSKKKASSKKTTKKTTKKKVAKKKTTKKKVAKKTAKKTAKKKVAKKKTTKKKVAKKTAKKTAKKKVAKKTAKKKVPKKK